MIILLPLLRKLSVRARTQLGAVLIAFGLVGVAVGVTAAPVLVIPAAVAAIVGVISLASARSAARRSPLSAR